MVSSDSPPTLLALGLQTGPDSYVLSERDAGGAYVARKSDVP